jgi:hypothetical protein
MLELYSHPFRDGLAEEESSPFKERFFKIF